jgi:hypothetical protein
LRHDDGDDDDDGVKTRFEYQSQRIGGRQVLKINLMNQSINLSLSVSIRRLC